MAILNKMTGFKVYKGTKADFISSGKASANVDAIVFITGGSDASKSCIYAQGTYFANFAELMAAINYVKGITVGETSYNAAAGGGYIGFGANDPSTVSVDVQNGKITIGLTDTFVNKVNNTATALGTSGDAAKADGSAFARIAALAADLASLTGSSSGSIAQQIAAVKTAIEGTLGTDDAKTLAAINDELDAIDAKWASYVSKAELEAIEDTKANGTSVNVSVTTKGGKVTAVEVDETGLNTALGLKANAADVYTKSETYTKTEVASEIAKEVAKIINDNDDASVNTLEEIATWIAAHPESVAAINKEISDLKRLVGTDKVADQITNKVNTLGKTDAAVTGQYVSAVSQANGIISVTRADLPTYTLAEGATNGTVKFNGAEVKVHGLGSAAFTESSAYDAAGAAAAVLGASGDAKTANTVYGAKAYAADVAGTAESNAKSYADSLFMWEEL